MCISSVLCEGETLKKCLSNEWKATYWERKGPCLILSCLYFYKLFFNQRNESFSDFPFCYTHFLELYVLSLLPSWPIPSPFLKKFPLETDFPLSALKIYILLLIWMTIFFSFVLQPTAFILFTFLYSQEGKFWSIQEAPSFHWKALFSGSLIGARNSQKRKQCLISDICVLGSSI